MSIAAPRLAIGGLVAAIVAFGAAFAIGKATVSSSKTAAPSAVTPVSVPAAPQVAAFTPSGSLPAPAKPKKHASSGGGGGGEGKGERPLEIHQLVGPLASGGIPC